MSRHGRVVDHDMQTRGATVAAAAEEAAVLARSMTHDLAPDAVDFYADALAALGRAGVPILVGGAWAFHRYADIARYTKDFDIFLRPGDVRRALAVLEDRGYRTEMAFAHWLAKAWSGHGRKGARGRPHEKIRKLRLPKKA